MDKAFAALLIAVCITGFAYESFGKWLDRAYPVDVNGCQVSVTPG